MSKDTSSFIVSCILLCFLRIKAIYKKLIKLKSDESIDAYFLDKNEISLSTIDKKDYPIIKKALKKKL